MAHPFAYPDTASPRAGIETVSARLAGGSVAILGIGGTGAYILDLIAKTPTNRILLVDGDTMQPHNAFRSPGAAPLSDLAAGINKADYFASIYGRMHTGIVTVPMHITSDTLSLLDEVDFVFVCVDTVDARRVIIPALEARAIPFIDAGLGLTLVDDGLMGQVRITTSTPTMRQHVHENHRIPMEDDGHDIYRSNIQIADMNALAAALAVMRWKRLRGFYVDQEQEYHSIFAVDGNDILNEDHLNTRDDADAADLSDH